MDTSSLFFYELNKERYMRHYIFASLFVISFFFLSFQTHASQTQIENVEIDLGLITTVTDMHETFEHNLSFPEYYGQNWDAFIDCMRDKLDLVSLNLELKNFKIFSKRFPRDAKILKDVLIDLKHENPNNLIFRIKS